MYSFSAGTAAKPCARSVQYAREQDIRPHRKFCRSRAPKYLCMAERPFLFRINQQGRLVVYSMAAVYHTQTGVSTPFFAGFTKSCGFPLARCTSGAAQKAAPRRRERRAGCCCYSLKRSIAVKPSSSGHSGWSAGRSPFGASWSAGSFSAASASFGLRWRAY